MECESCERRHVSLVPWINPVARLGYPAGPIVYLVIGVMAILMRTGP
jgi:hypothetical protein